jgi:hypothetical protein
VLHIHNSESENTCSYNSLGKHCQIMFLRTFGGRRPPTDMLAFGIKVKLIKNQDSVCRKAYYEWIGTWPK